MRIDLGQHAVPPLVRWALERPSAAFACAVRGDPRGPRGPEPGLRICGSQAGVEFVGERLREEGVQLEAGFLDEPLAERGERPRLEVDRVEELGEERDVGFAERRCRIGWGQDRWVRFERGEGRGLRAFPHCK